MRCQNFLKCQNSNADSSVAEILLFPSTVLDFLFSLGQEIKNILLAFEKSHISTEHEEIISKAEFNQRVNLKIHSSLFSRLKNTAFQNLSVICLSL